MAVKITYQTPAHKNDMGDRFVRASFAGAGKPNGYRWCIRGALNLRYDIQQGTCDAEDLPAEVRERADNLLGHAFGYVEWPQ